MKFTKILIAITASVCTLSYGSIDKIDNTLPTNFKVPPSINNSTQSSSGSSTNSTTSATPATKIKSTNSTTSTIKPAGEVLDESMDDDDDDGSGGPSGGGGGGSDSGLTFVGLQTVRVPTPPTEMWVSIPLDWPIATLAALSGLSLTEIAAIYYASMSGVLTQVSISQNNLHWMYTATAYAIYEDQYGNQTSVSQGPPDNMDVVVEVLLQFVGRGINLQIVTIDNRSTYQWW
jgi:hypothetical protein